MLSPVLQLEIASLMQGPVTAVPRNLCLCVDNLMSEQLHLLRAP